MTENLDGGVKTDRTPRTTTGSRLSTFWPPEAVSTLLRTPIDHEEERALAEKTFNPFNHARGRRLYRTLYAGVLTLLNETNPQLVAPLTGDDQTQARIAQTLVRGITAWTIRHACRDMFVAGMV